LRKILFTGNSFQLESLVENPGFEWINQRFIETQIIPFQVDVNLFDWIFFSSREAVHSFFSKKFSTEKCLFAAVGKGTADALSEYAIPSFIGESTNTSEVGQAFAEQIGSSKVLFPCSTISKQTIQSHLSPSQFENLVCYETVLIDKKIEQPSIAIFSSPSNVDGFLLSNTLKGIQKIIVYGPTTGQHIQDLGYSADIILQEINESAIVDAIKKSIAGL
jgi:uroporphyrinogen-III synthase